MITTTVTNGLSRKEWREHLADVACNEMRAECEQGEYTPAEYTAFARGMALVIANATWLETDSTSDLEGAVYDQILEAKATHEQKYQRERWKRAVNTEATDLGFHDWVAAYA